MDPIPPCALLPLQNTFHVAANLLIAKQDQTLLEILHISQRTQLDIASTRALAVRATFSLEDFWFEYQQQEPAGSEQMLLLPYDFSGRKHILSNVFHWHHLRFLAVWWRNLCREIPNLSEPSLEIQPVTSISSMRLNQPRNQLGPVCPTRA